MITAILLCILFFCHFNQSFIFKKSTILLNSFVISSFGFMKFIMSVLEFKLKLFKYPLIFISKFGLYIPIFGNVKSAISNSIDYKVIFLFYNYILIVSKSIIQEACNFISDFYLLNIETSKTQLNI